MATIPMQRALEIATDHTARVPLGHPDYRMGCELAGRIGDGWLFSYRIECLRDIPASEQEQFAGAGGFIVSANGEARDLSVPMFIEAERKVETTGAEVSALGTLVSQFRSDPVYLLPADAVMEGATSLRDRFDEGARLTLAEALDLMHSLLFALGEIHDSRVIHRNLHPGSVLVDGAGGVTLRGFELADGPGLLHHDEMSGAWVTMSPEQIQGTGCDARSDIFQAGVIFYQMLTGEPPFAGSGSWSKAEKILREDPTPPSSVNPAVPASLDAVSLRALAKDPTQRYERAAEFAGALVRAVPELHNVLRASVSPRANTLERLAIKLARAWVRASRGLRAGWSRAFRRPPR